jgi:TPR repeat protein
MDMELPVAFSSMGEMYENGWGVQKDLAQARKHYARACAMGYARVCVKAKAQA